MNASPDPGSERLGLTLPFAGVPLNRQTAALLTRAEELGYTDVWSSETSGPDAFTPLALAAGATERMRLGTGIAGVFQRGPALLAQEAAALADISDGRFVLGLGASSDRIVAGWNAIPFERPYSRVRETLELVRPVLDGERNQLGFKLDTPPRQRVPIVLAALRGRMLRLAAESADGAFTNFLPLSGVERVRAELAEAPPGFDLLCRFFCLPGERAEVEPTARFMFASYITVPVYAAFFEWLGHGEAIAEMREAWAARDRERALAAAPWELIEQTFVLGTPAEMKTRLAAFRQAGITTPILMPVCPPDRLPALIEALAPPHPPT